MKKKIISIIIAVALIASALTVAMVSASAKVVDGRYEPSTSDTYRYYFYMPKDWENSYTQSTVAGVYWFGGTDACSSISDDNPDAPAWPGYIAQYDGTYADGSIYYIDCPTDVSTIIWNNYVNGGTHLDGVYETSKEQFEAAKQTTDICGLDDAETYANYDLYPDGLKSFNNMIYVLDYSQTEKNFFSGREIYRGEWYYYYGDGQYGVQPTLEEAEAANTVMNTEYQPPKSNTEPTTQYEPSSPYEPTSPTMGVPSTYPTDYKDPVAESKTINFDVSSANWGSGVKAVYCHIYNYFGDDGKRYTGWQTKAEKCSYDTSTGIATYDLQTGIDKGADGLETIDNTNKWVIMFSCNTGAETYGLIFNSDCFGDTIVADPYTKYENAIDSEKLSIKIGYSKNTNLTSPKCITSTGKVQGESFAYGETDAKLLGSYVANYFYDDTKVDKDTLSKIIKELNINQSVETFLGDYLVAYALDVTVVNKEIVSNIADALGIHPSEAYDYAVEKIDMDDDNYPTYAQKKAAINAIKYVIDSIPEAIPGDVNGDGKVGIDDATDIQKYIVEIYEFSDYQKKLSDVDKDGKIGVDDVTLIQKSLAGLAVIE